MKGAPRALLGPTEVSQDAAKRVALAKSKASPGTVLQVRYANAPTTRRSAHDAPAQWAQRAALWTLSMKAASEKPTIGLPPMSKVGTEPLGLRRRIARA